MLKRFLSVLLVGFLVIGIGISMLNFLAVEENAQTVKWEELHEKTLPGGYIWWCKGDGEGCCTVSPDPSAE